MVVIPPPKISSVKAATGLLLLVVVVSSMALVGAATSGFMTTQTADSGTVAPGDNVTLTVRLDNVSSDANAAGVDVGLPDNWTVVSSMDSELGNPNKTQVVFSENRTEFALIINSTTNTSFSVSYTVAVPTSASDKKYSIAANGSYYNTTENTTIWDNTTTNVEVSTSVVDEYDTNGESGIQIGELNTAIDDYFLGEIGIGDLNELIDAYFRSL